MTNPSQDFCDTDSDDQLPGGWEERVADSGAVYYANHQTESTQWTHPVSGKQKFVKGKLPFGWEKRIDEDGGITFVDTINNRTTFTDPRLAFAQENRRSGPRLKQTFDGGSTALEVLMGHDLSDKYVIVTGATSGIGYETARSLAFHGAHVIMACRDVIYGDERRAAIVAERSYAKLTVAHLDLASLASIRRFADEYIDKEWPLHILILNAATLEDHSYTEDGLVTTIQVNYIAHYLLTRLLKDVLVTSRGTRIIHVSSESHRFSRSLDFNNLTRSSLTPAPGKQHFFHAYNLSKLCNVLFAKELHRRWGSEYGLVSISLHPGNIIPTRISRHSWLVKFITFLARPFTKSLQQGAATTVYCAVAPELDDAGGEYFNNCCRCVPSDQSLEPELARALWVTTERILRERQVL